MIPNTKLYYDYAKVLFGDDEKKNKVAILTGRQYGATQAAFQCLASHKPKGMNVNVYTSGSRDSYSFKRCPVIYNAWCDHYDTEPDLDTINITNRLPQSSIKTRSQTNRIVNIEIFDTCCIDIDSASMSKILSEDNSDYKKFLYIGGILGAETIPRLKQLGFYIVLYKNSFRFAFDQLYITPNLGIIDLLVNDSNPPDTPLDNTTGYII
jgi:hypothetical protein